MAITSPTYDPATTAAALAENYVAKRQEVQATQTKKAQAAAKALNELKGAISSYQASLYTMATSTSILSRTAKFGDEAFGSASATAAASAGSYSFFVERLATASQVAFSAIPNAASSSGTLGISLNGAPSFSVDLNSADTDGLAGMTTRELAMAINAAPDNKGKVSASVVNINGVAELVLTSQSTGAAGTITLDASGITDAPLQAALDPANARTLVAAQDALIRLGAENGTAIQQASNTFTNIDGVSMTFTKAHAAGAAPVTITVAADNSTTTANVQKFVNEYNRLKSVIDAMVSAGNPAEKKAAGVFSDDGGVRVLQNRLVSILRQAGTGSLAAYGITAARDGTLSLDAARLTKQLAVDPNGLDTLIGKASATAPSGIAGNLDSYLKQWSSASNGQIKQRLESNDKLLVRLEQRQEELDQQYNGAYQRYLKQFTMLQGLQAQMNSSSSMLDALFGNKKD
ncbi:flagellar filament capping protein FliD [Massilia soli]|nr:flagellar filament capping protein FliD [Massilia soli]